MMPQEAWMDLMSFRALALAGASWAEIGRVAGCDWRTARRYLTAERPRPPRYGPRPPAPRLIDPVAATIDAWLRSEPRLGAFTVFERLQAEPYRFSGSYETVKRYVRVRRPEILRELGIREQREQMHRRFEVLAGSQAQVDWGDEGTIATGSGELHVYSFHMVLAHSRDPFCRYVTSMDLATFWACHTEAFTHFGASRPRSWTTGQRPWYVATSAGARTCRCTPRPWRSRSTTGSRSSCATPSGPRPRAGWSGRWRSPASTSCGAGRSPRSRACSGPGPSGSPSAALRSTGPTARSSPIAPSGTGPPCVRCPSVPTSCVSATSARWARTPW